MAVKIRLKRMGKIRAPHYRIVVADSRTKRDGRVIEEIGKYHPKEDPSFIEVDSDRAQYWLGVGAQPSEPVTAILKVTGDWQRFQGEAAPEPMKVAEPRRDKAELFNEALKDSHGDPAVEAVTARRTPAKKAATPPAAEATSSAPAAADAPTAPTGDDSVSEPATDGSASVPATPTPAEEAPVAETSPVDASAAAEALSQDVPGSDSETLTEPPASTGAEPAADAPTGIDERTDA